MKNLGVIIENKPKDFVAGTLPYEVLNPTGDWTVYLPTGEVQYSHYADSMACVTFSCLNVLETQYKFLTGREINFSDRFIAKVSGTTQQGNSVQRVLDAINTYGLVLEEDYPAPKDFTWDEYYSEIPPEIFAKANKTLKVAYEFHQPDSDFNKELKHVPFEMIIEKVNPYHSVEMANTSQEFDSYEPFLKPQKSIYITTKIILKGVIMSNAQFVKKSGTNEYGFYLPAMSEDALKDKAFNLGINILNPDGSINYGSAKEVTGL